MLNRFHLRTLLLSLVLVWLGPACEASSLGLTVHVEPLQSDGGEKVRAHFTVIASNPCPSLSGVCTGAEDCVAHTTSSPFSGTRPGSGWCVRQWYQTLPSRYNSTMNVGSDTEFFVSMNTGPHTRSNSGRLNQPAVVALAPPLRGRVNCPHHFHVEVKDPDGDRVHCRFASAAQGECVDCTPHSFIELDEDKCMVTFTGEAEAGQYHIYLMAEDLIPMPRTRQSGQNTPLSSVPVHLSLTVEESSTSCTDEPLATDDTPDENSMHYVLPYEEAGFQLTYTAKESVEELAVVGPPGLQTADFRAVGNMASMKMAWVRAVNSLAHLLPICFVANTESLQSEPRCVWLYQRDTKALPAGTELKCEDTKMSLELPISSLSSIDLEELQLNSVSCSVNVNSTHVIADIPLDDCGTVAVHSGSELIYTNVLKSKPPQTMISRQPSLILPVACRIPAVQVKDPHLQISMPTEEETFGNVDFWLEFHFPGEGPMADETRAPQLRSLVNPQGRGRREASGSHTSFRNREVGSKVETLDLHVMSNCTVGRAEMMVSNCKESETADFSESHPILEGGCSSSGSTAEVVTSTNTSKVYRLQMGDMQSQGTEMYVECTVNLCITTTPSEECPDLCTRSFEPRVLLNNLYTKTYTIKSDAVSLVVTTPGPSVTPTVAVTNPSNIQATTANAPEKTPFMALGLILAASSLFLQHVLQ